MSASDSSELSSAPSEDETLQLTKKNGILKFFTKVQGPKAGATSKAAIPKSPPRPKRAPSPEHETVFADNQDIAVRLFVAFLHVPNAWVCAEASLTNSKFIVMYRSRFTDAFPKSLANFGPQELERDVINEIPGEHAEQFLCAVLGLLLNRKQDVKWVDLFRSFGTDFAITYMLMLRTERDTIIELWRKLYRLISHSGLRIGN